MNKQPVSYKQTDKKWSSLNASVSGGTMNLGRAGCGPTSAAMLIATLKDKNVTPVDTFKWDCAKGYMYLNQGTAYSYFKPQFAAYGIACDIVTWDICKNANSPIRNTVIDLLKKGYYIIALMNKGLWTSSGHFVVVWWCNDKVRINDPASSRSERENGDLDLFFSQAKYFWWVDARKYNDPTYIEDLNMTLDEAVNSLTTVQLGKIVDKLTDEQAAKLVTKANKHFSTLPLPTSWEAERELKEAIELGLTDGSRPMALSTRLEDAVMIKRGVTGHK